MNKEKEEKEVLGARPSYCFVTHIHSTQRVVNKEEKEEEVLGVPPYL
jgi:hypothetical protein